jgi:ketosteroid isomerase-like protein
VSGGTAEIARRAYDAFNRGGVDAILEFIDPEIEWRMWEEFARTSRVYHGHGGVREVLALFEENLDGFRADPHEFIELPDRVVVPVRLHGTVRGTGDERAYEVVQVWATRDGRRASRLDVYGSREEALAAAADISSGSPGRAGGA